ncbi:hypothetical protein [Corallococcus exiguus]|uniref:hypothetical protein n=1 Tax=Corallococcus exiguus TaxID=83462 RepID=UPI0030B8140B
MAKEMRALSSQSLQSTQRIGKILLEINQAIRETVGIAEDGQPEDGGGHRAGALVPPRR